MARIGLAGPAMAVALTLTAALATSVVVAQAPRAPALGVTPAQAAPGDTVGQTPRNPDAQRPAPDDEYGDSLRDFEDYAGDWSGQRGRGDREDRMGRGRRFGGPMRGGAGAMFGICGPDGGRVAARLLERLERLTAPTQEQRPAFDKLKGTVEKAGETARAGCPTERPITPSGRLAAAEKRLSSLLEAVRMVRPALDEYFNTLSDEQKARFYAATSRRGFGREGGRGWRGPRHMRERWQERRQRWQRWREERRGTDDKDDGRRPRDGWPGQWRGRS